MSEAVDGGQSANRLALLSSGSRLRSGPHSRHKVTVIGDLRGKTACAGHIRKRLSFGKGDILQMTDSELRGIVLKEFYEKRHVLIDLQISDIMAINPNESLTKLANICKQLDEHGLVKWQSMKSQFDVQGGIGRITARGVDVIEGTVSSPISITFHDKRISVRSSSNVQVGNSNNQSISLQIDKLIAAVDHSRASDGEKAEAKSLLRAIAGNPLVQSVLGVFGFGGSAS
jgi:hypothetical protein